MGREEGSWLEKNGFIADDVVVERDVEGVGEFGDQRGVDLTWEGDRLTDDVVGAELDHTTDGGLGTVVRT